jgi:hypothetical protein
MMRALIYTGLIVAGMTVGVLAAPYASADAGDGPYLNCLTRGWGFPSTNVLGSLNWGHSIRDAIGLGGVDPVVERNYVYAHSDVSTLTAANVMVNCATSAYLGFGPPLT